MEVTSDDGQELVNVERLGQEVRGARARSSSTVTGSASPLRMTTGIAAVAGVAASWRRMCSPLVSGRRLSSRMRAGWSSIAALDAVAAGHGGVQLDVRAAALEQALDEQDVVLIVVDVQHDAVHGIGAARGGRAGRAVVSGCDGVD